MSGETTKPHPTRTTRAFLMAGASLDLALLIVFSILALDDQQHFDWAAWWDYHFVHYSFSTSFFDLILVSLVRSLACFVVGLDCFAPCFSRLDCCCFQPELASYPTMKEEESSFPSASASASAAFDHQRQMYNPFSSKFSRVSALALAIAIMLVNLPFLLIKILVFNNDPFSLYYMLCLISALCLSIFEAPLLLKLWLLKKRIHGLRNYLRKNILGQRRKSQRSPSTKETSPLLLGRQQQGGGASLAGTTPGKGDDPGFVDFYYFTDSSDDDYDTDNDDIVTDDQGLFIAGNHSNNTSTASAPVPISSSSRSRSPSSLEAASFDAFRSPQGSFVSAREALSDMEDLSSPSSPPRTPSRASAQRRSFRTPSINGERPRSVGGAADADNEICSIPVPREEDPAGNEPGNAGSRSQLLTLLRSAMGVGDMDSLRLQMPSWIHEGDSMLERQASMDFPKYLSAIPNEKTPLGKMVAVVRFFLANLRTHSPGKKPFNPILGEQFHCTWPGTSIRFYAEQVSHHPPICTFAYVDPASGVEYQGTSRSVSSFTGTAIKVVMKGKITLVVRNPWNEVGEPAPVDTSMAENPEEYAFELPEFYLRGILVGNPVPDFGGKASITCWQTGCTAVLTFPEKPLIGGEARRVEGQIMDEMGNARYRIEGTWDGAVSLYQAQDAGGGGGEGLLLLPPVENEVRVKPVAKPPAEQSEMESQRIWYSCTSGIREQNWKFADKAKHTIEELQRRYHRDMESGAVPPYSPMYFDRVSQDPLGYKFVGETAAKKRTPWLRLYKH